MRTNPFSRQFGLYIACLEREVSLRMNSLHRRDGYAVPGRGLEPLRIAPPDPKSGASANFATLAGCDDHERRFVSSFGQIALVRLLGLLQQIEPCLHKSLAGPFSCRYSRHTSPGPPNRTGGKFRFW